MDWKNKTHYFKAKPPFVRKTLRSYRDDGYVLVHFHFEDGATIFVISAHSEKLKCVLLVPGHLPQQGREDDVELDCRLKTGLQRHFHHCECKSRLENLNCKVTGSSAQKNDQFTLRVTVLTSSCWEKHFGHFDMPLPFGPLYTPCQMLKLHVHV